MKHRVINHSLQPQMLDSGVQLASAGTPGSVREDVKLSAGDRTRLVATGVVSVVEVEEEEPVIPQAVPAPDKPAVKRAPAGRRD